MTREGKIIGKGPFQLISRSYFIVGPKDPLCMFSLEPVIILVKFCFIIFVNGFEIFVTHTVDRALNFTELGGRLQIIYNNLQMDLNIEKVTHKVLQKGLDLWQNKDLNEIQGVPGSISL